MKSIALTKEQVKKCKHMLGLNYSKVSFRNYYCSGQQVDHDFDIFISNDLMTKRNSGEGMGGYYYHLTDKGIEFIRGFIGNFKMKRE